MKKNYGLSGTGWKFVIVQRICVIWRKAACGGGRTFIADITDGNNSEEKGESGSPFVFMNRIL